MDRDKTPHREARFREIKRLFDAALDLPEHERDGFLDRECAADHDMRAKLARILTEHDRGAVDEISDDLGIVLFSAALPELRAGNRIDVYRLDRRLGEGGMGEVWLARQTEHVKRRVALKVIKHGMDTRQVVARFEAERQALAMMEHTSVARVLDAGSTPQGRPYFVMEYVDGLPINEHCDRHRLSTPERLELFTHVCSGVQHAHQKALIHRDLKPSNVLVTMQDGTAIPKIIDFGVAKATSQKLTERTMFTELGVLVGTPEYMSPEQADAEGADVDTRTDVYSLGVMLYELLVGALPFDTRLLREAGYDEMRRLIRESDPPRPSARLSTLGKAATESARRRRTDPPTLRRQLAEDLDWITMKALEKDRARRYATPMELAADLRRHLRSEPVLAGPPRLSYRAGKFVRRHRLAVAAAGAVLLAILIGLVGATVGLVQARRAERRAVRAELDRRVELQRSLVAQAIVGRESKRPGQRAESLSVLNQAAALALQLEMGESEILALRRELIVALTLPDISVDRSWPLPEGHLEVAFDDAAERFAIGNERGEVTVRSFDDGARQWEFPGDGRPVDGLAFDGTGRWLAAQHSVFSEPLKWLRVWDTTDGRRTLDVRSERGFLLRPDGGGVFFPSTSGDWAFADLPAGEIRFRIELPPVASIRFSPEGERIAIVDRSGGLHVLSLPDGHELTATRLDPPFSEYATLDWHDDGLVVAAAFGRTLTFWDTGSRRDWLRRRIVLPAKAWWLDFHPTARWLVAGAHDQTLRIYDVASAGEIVKMPGWPGGFSGDGSWLTVRQGQQVKRVALAPTREFTTILTPDAGTASNESLSIGSEGRLLASACPRGVWLWDLERGEQLAFLDIGPTKGAVFDPANGELLTSGAAGLLRWPVVVEEDAYRIGPPGLEPGAPAGPTGSIAIDASGDVLIVEIGRAHAVSLDRTGSRDPVRFPKHDNLWRVALSPDGVWAATGAWNGLDVNVWETSTGRLVRTLPAMGGVTRATVAFSPDGQWLATSTNRREVRLWHVGTWQPGPRLAVDRSGERPPTIAFAPGGDILAVETAQDAMTLLRLDEGLRELATLEVPALSMLAVAAFSSDGHKLVLGDREPLVHVWRLDEVRRRLHAAAIDWSPATIPAHRTPPSTPLQVSVDLGIAAQS